ncbi:primosomal protein N' [Agaribacter flavus]|uniref:Replication restart protein PriA n=1 Tax=Agaribacter flavus TaxID=1902781 RepID=A0ABV7FUL6_9ALTE
MKVVQVAIPIPLRKQFNYQVPEELPNILSLKVGMRVLVPFSNKKLVGIVCDLDASTDVDETKLKSIEAILDEFPVLSSHLLVLGVWLADYYLHPLGETLFSMLPAKLRKHEKLTELNQTYLKIAENVERKDALLSLRRAKKQLALFRALFDHSLSLSEAKSEYSTQTVKALEEKKLIEYEERIAPKNEWQHALSIERAFDANVEQAIAISTINKCSTYATFLLEGVTGSGKTEVYLQVIEAVLKKRQQVLILVPEIGLTPQTADRFQRRFGEIVAMMHSGLSDSQRLCVWHQARRGDVGIVIGTRSSVFLPFENLGMIIVDEEHDDSFKQQDGLRYHARDLAVFRAVKLNIPLILGSATPSLESLHNANTQKYHHLTLSNRAGNASLPSQHLLNITGQQLQCGIAQGILDKMAIQLAEGNQVLIFVNRRGFAPSLICHQCGHVETCVGCESPFTMHKIAGNLQCHRCGNQRYIPHKCSQCGNTDLSTEGQGTEQVEGFLSAYFSNYSCVRIDSDSTRSKARLNEILESINNNKHQILIGTQILSKGHHFPNVTLGLVLNLDALLFSEDFRAAEKMGQLITQLSGRAGRANKQGEVWLQTHQPQHPLVQDLVNNGFMSFSRSLLEERRAANLPPFSFQALLRAESQHLDRVLEFLNYAKSMLAQFINAKVIGPLPCVMEKKQGRLRYQLVIQSDHRGYLLSIMQQALIELDNHKLSSRIRWLVDMQPQDFS